MKRADKSSEKISNFDQLISKFSEKEILNTQAMSYIRGGDGEGDGSEPINIILNLHLSKINYLHVERALLKEDNAFLFI